MCKCRFSARRQVPALFSVSPHLGRHAKVRVFGFGVYRVRSPKTLQPYSKPEAPNTVSHKPLQ